jgi:hypothetical protein
MRRPLNWFVFGLSLAFLFANLTFGHKPAPPVEQAAIPLSVQVDFPHLVIGEPTAPQFGYVRDDGSFLPLVQPP